MSAVMAAVPDVDTLRKMRLPFLFGVGDCVATFNPFWAPGGDLRTIIGKVVSTLDDGQDGTPCITLRPFNVDPASGACTLARGPALRYYAGACWPIQINNNILDIDPEEALQALQRKKKRLPKGWVWADAQFNKAPRTTRRLMNVTAPSATVGSDGGVNPRKRGREAEEDVAAAAACLIGLKKKFKSANPEVKDEVNAFLALAAVNASRALVLDTHAFQTTRALRDSNPKLKIDIPNNDAEEVCAMRAVLASDKSLAPGIEVAHCTAHDMLLGDARTKYQLVFLDYCGMWRKEDVNLMFKHHMARRGVVAVTICRRTPRPEADRNEEDRMREEFDRLATANGFDHVCLKTFRYAGSMLTCVYEVVRCV
jgi:hypothetical protein